MTCNTHGWKMLAPYQWCNKQNTLLYAMNIAGMPVDVSARQRGMLLVARLDSRAPLTSDQRKIARAGLRRAFDLHTDTQALFTIARKRQAPLAALVRAGAGRLLKSSSLWEDAAKTLFTTNCSWGLTMKIAAACCGPALSKATPSGRYPFPEPSVIARLTPEQLRKLLPVGYRARALHLLAGSFAATGPEMEQLLLSQSYSEAMHTVRMWHGFGQYAASHVLLLMGMFNAIPIDTVVRDYVRTQYQRSDVEQLIAERYDSWGEFKWWGMKLEKIAKRANWLGD